MSEREVNWEYGLTIEKLASDRDGNLYIAGYASNDMQDEDGEVMDLDTLKSVYKQYMKNPVIKFMHDKSPQWKGAIGTVVPEYTDSDGTVHKTAFSQKPYLVIKLAKGLPTWMVDSVEQGIYKGLSVGGKLAKKVGNRLYVKSWLETSLVDVPSAKGSFVDVLKAAGEALNEEEDADKKKKKEADEGITQKMSDLDSIVKARRLAEANSGIDCFLKGGVGSGIKGHTTPKQKYEAKSKALRKAFEEAMSKFKAMETEGLKLSEEAHKLIDEGHDQAIEMTDAGKTSAEIKASSASTKIDKGRILAEQARDKINAARVKMNDAQLKHKEAQIALSEKYLLSTRKPKKKPEVPDTVGIAKPPSQDEIDNHTRLGEESAKKEARRERAKKRREAKKAEASKAQAETTLGEVKTKIEGIFGSWNRTDHNGDGGLEFSINSKDGKIDVNAYLMTGDRGPRMDHGSGEDSWMTDGEYESAVTPYERKYKPVVERLQGKLNDAGFSNVKVSMDYGEKGHIALNVYGDVDPSVGGKKGSSDDAKAKRKARREARKAKKAKEVGVPETGPIYREIKRMKDDNGRILTYAVEFPYGSGNWTEKNSLKEAKILARDTDAEDKRDAPKLAAERKRAEDLLKKIEKEEKDGTITAPKKVSPSSVRVEGENVYEGTHGKRPKGKGNWGFKIGKEEVFAPSALTYTGAKKWAKAKAAEKGESSITVLT